MSKYDLLRNALKAHNEAEHDYYHDLKLRAAQFTDGFSVFLGLTEDTYKEPNGNISSYIQLHKRGGGGEVHYLYLEGEGGAIEFDVGVTLETEKNSFPKTVLTIPFNIAKTEDSYLIWSDYTEIAARIDLDSDDYEEPYQQLFLEIQKHFDKRPKFEPRF